MEKRRKRRKQWGRRRRRQVTVSLMLLIDSDSYYTVWILYAKDAIGVSRGNGPVKTAPEAVVS